MGRHEYAHRPAMPPDVRTLLASQGVDIEARERKAREDIRAGRRKPAKPTAPTKTRSTTPRRDAARRWLDSVT